MGVLQVASAARAPADGFGRADVELVTDRLVKLGLPHAVGAGAGVLANIGTDS